MNDSPIAFARPVMGAEEQALVAEVIGSGWIVGGPKVQAFEQRVAEHCGRGEGIAVSSWTTGAFLLLHAWGLGPGDEVLVPSLTFIASVNVIRHVRATPVFVEADPETFNIDVADAAAKVTNRTRAIIPVDQLGMPCDMAGVQALADGHGLRVLADAACSLGSTRAGRPCGAEGDAAVFSLHARKVVTTGEGGMIVTDDVELAARLRRLRHQGMSLSDAQRHGASPTLFESYNELGFNFRMTDLQGALGLAQMDRLADMLGRRRAVAEIYTQALTDDPHLAPPAVPPGCQPNWQTYQVRLRRGDETKRNAIMDALHARGIPTRRGVMASHLEGVYGLPPGTLPVTERMAATTFQLPMHAALGEADARRVAEAVRAVAAERAEGPLS